MTGPQVFGDIVATLGEHAPAPTDDWDMSPAPRDGCPVCGAHNIRPWRTIRATPEWINSQYRCPCGAVWTTGWSATARTRCCS